MVLVFEEWTQMSVLLRTGAQKKENKGVELAEGAGSVEGRVTGFVPRVQSGGNSYRNLVSPCMECNSLKCERSATDLLAGSTVTAA